ncbi:MAG: GNAT family N-acetyltransferase [Trueperella sp.]|nr:GNAT family N-acetyltransferase [Trueperella sp.]
MSAKKWSWRALTAADVPLVYGLICEIEAADEAPVRTSRNEVYSYFSPSHIWRAQGAWVGEELIAFGLARVPRDGYATSPITLSGGVSTAWRLLGLGSELMNRQLEAAQNVAADAQITDPRVILYVESGEEDLRNIAQLLDFTQLTSFVQLRRELHSVEELAQPSQYISVAPVSSDWVEQMRKAHNRVLSDLPTWSKMDADAWDSFLNTLEKDWCFVAIDNFGDRPRLAGYLLASRYESPDESEPTLEGYVEEIVVLPEWRGKRVSTGMLSTAINAMAKSDVDYIGIDITIPPGVDIEDSEQVVMFEHFGFVRVAETLILGRDL